MTRTIHAVYEEGVLRPLEDPGLREHQQVLLDLRLVPEGEPEVTLRKWRQVYDGLSPEEVAEVEAIALDRSRFMRQEP